VTLPTPSAARIASLEFQERWNAVAENGTVTPYTKRGKDGKALTYYRVRVKVAGKWRDIYSHKGATFANRGHAQSVLEQVRGALANGTDSLESIAGFLPQRSKPNLVTTLLLEYADDLRQRVQAGELSHHTLRNFVRRLPREPATKAQHFAWWVGTSVNELTPKKVRDFMRHLQRLGLQPTSVKLTLDQFRAFLSWCVEEERLSKVPKFPTVKTTRKRPALLLPRQQAKVLQAIPAPARGIFLLMALGVRPNAARAVRVEDVREGFVLIRRGVQSHSAQGHEGPTKARREKWVPMTRELYAWVQEHASGRLPAARLFCNPLGRHPGQPWGHSALTRVWLRACRVAEVPDVPLYQGTKHSFATGRLAAGKSKDAVAEFMQISRGQVDTYAQWARELSAEVLDEDVLAEETQATVRSLRGEDT